MAPVKRELGKTPTEQQWHDWVNKWSRLSMDEFFRSTIYQSDDDPKLRPWTEQAIQAYQVSTYTPLCHYSVVTVLREELGEWWVDPLYTLTNGMDSLPNAFMQKNKHGWNKEVDLSKNIIYGIRVDKVEEIDEERVKVFGTNLSTSKRIAFGCDAVFLTVPLPILRQVDVPLSVEKQKALASITYQSSTKIMLQCRTRFWQKEVGQGGFSRTNMQIGQLHYPDYDTSGIADNERGILMVYTWGQNALTFGAEDHRTAIESAVHQISKIHKDILDEFEVGVVQAWHSDPYAQGAYAALLPFEYIDAFKTLVKPTKRIFLAGEAMSWANGWIQGAIFSSLIQAYCLQELVDTGKMHNPIELML